MIAYHCSFCGKSKDHVSELIAGPGNIFICDECVWFCGEIIAENKERKAGFAHDMLVGDDALSLYRH